MVLKKGQSLVRGLFTICHLHANTEFVLKKWSLNAGGLSSEVLMLQNWTGKKKKKLTSNTIAVNSILGLAGGPYNIVFVQAVFTLGLREGAVRTFCHLITNFIDKQRHFIGELLQVQFVQGPEDSHNFTEDTAVEDDKVLINHGHDRIGQHSTIAGKVFVAQSFFLHLK